MASYIIVIFIATAIDTHTMYTVYTMYDLYTAMSVYY